MSQQHASNPLSASEPWNLVADGYAETTMRVFEQFADEAITASKLKPNSTVLDVACGPDALAHKLSQYADKVHDIYFSVSMRAVFKQAVHYITFKFSVINQLLFVIQKGQKNEL